MPQFIIDGLPLLKVFGFILALDFIGAVFSLLFLDNPSSQVSEGLATDIQMTTRVLFVLWVLQTIVKVW